MDVVCVMNCERTRPIEQRICYMYVFRQTDGRLHGKGYTLGGNLQNIYVCPCQLAGAGQVRGAAPRRKFWLFTPPHTALPCTTPGSSQTQRPVRWWCSTAFCLTSSACCCTHSSSRCSLPAFLGSQVLGVAVLAVPLPLDQPLLLAVVRTVLHHSLHIPAVIHGGHLRPDL